MKDGDRIVAIWRQIFREAWWESLVEYDPDWLFWEEWVWANLN